MPGATELRESEHDFGGTPLRIGEPCARTLKQSLLVALRASPPDYAKVAAKWRMAERLGVDEQLADVLFTELNFTEIEGMLASGFVGPALVAEWLYDGHVAVAGRLRIMEALAQGYSERISDGRWDKSCLGLVSALSALDFTAFERCFPELTPFAQAYAFLRNAIDHTDFREPAAFEFPEGRGSLEQFRGHFTMDPISWDPVARTVRMNVHGPQFGVLSFDGEVTLNVEGDHSAVHFIPKGQTYEVALTAGDLRFLIDVLFERMETQGGIYPFDGIANDESPQDPFAILNLGYELGDYQLIRVDTVTGHPYSEIEHSATALRFWVTQGPEGGAWCVIRHPSGAKSVDFPLSPRARRFFNHVISLFEVDNDDQERPAESL